MRNLLIHSNSFSFSLIHIELSLKLTELSINILHRNSNVLICEICGLFCIKFRFLFCLSVECMGVHIF